ncbi:MAG: hypothetical protein L0Z47_03265 [Actinobacteria bacterium]|nr:hypothetical protein [Actinomycetota bacterium]MCI0678805.1 hypothetical protein [Actinomycetota bacterium]
MPHEWSLRAMSRVNEADVGNGVSTVTRLFQGEALHSDPLAPWATV